MDFTGTDVLLELRERGRRVGAVEAADRHDRLAGRELVTRGVVRADRRGRPAEPGALLEQRGYLRARNRAVEESAGPSAPTGRTRPTAGRAAADCGTGKPGRTESGVHDPGIEAAVVGHATESAARPSRGAESAVPRARTETAGSARGVRGPRGRQRATVRLRNGGQRVRGGSREPERGRRDRENDTEASAKGW